MIEGESLINDGVAITWFDDTRQNSDYDAVWGGLTRRQQDILRTTVRNHFADALLPAAGAASRRGRAARSSGTGGRSRSSSVMR